MQNKPYTTLKIKNMYILDILFFSSMLNLVL